MKALSLIQPWAWAVLHAGKDCENRTWKLPEHMIGQRVVIHSSKGWDKGGAEYLYDVSLLGDIDKPPAIIEMYPRGVLLGELTITDCRHIDEIQVGNMWQFGPYCFGLKDPLIYAQPIAWKGALGFWDVPDDVVAKLRRGEME